MKAIREKLLRLIARLLGVPVKVREEYYGGARGCSSTK